MKDRASREPSGFFRKLLRWMFILMFMTAVVGIGCAVGVVFYLSEDLPKISTLSDYRPPIITTVYSDDNRKIAEFYKERRIVLPLPEMPKMLIEAFVAAEDARFYQHKGVDFISILIKHGKCRKYGKY